jgi:hypothetical protein
VFAKYNWNYQVKEDEMGRACRRAAYRISVRKLKGKRPLGRPRCRWILEKYDDMDYIGLAQDRDQWGKALVNTVMNLQVP